MVEVRNLSMAGQGGKPARPVVLQVLPSLVTGGAERGAVDVAVALARAGGTPIVASSGGPMVRELERNGILHLTLPLASKNPLVMRRNVGRLEEVIRTHQVDIVHARSRAPAWSAYYAAQRTGARFMTTFHAAYKFSNRLKRHYNSIMARGERVIAISAFIRDHILSTYGTDPRAVRLIHRGIDLRNFSPERVSQERMIHLARQWRIPEDRHVILLPGRMTRIKGHHLLIQALAKLGRQDVYALLVGADQGRTDYRREVEQAIAAHGLGGIVHMTGHCSDMAAAYALADVVVSASTVPEGFGRTIVEAQAMGKPVIVTNLGAVRETVLEGETGWVVPPEDPAAMAAAIAAAVEMTPEQRAAVAARAIDFVSDHFTRDRMCRDTLGVYEELLLEPPHPLGGAVTRQRA